MMRLLSFFPSFSHAPQGPPLDLRLTGPRVSLRRGNPADWRAWREMRAASRAFLQPWEPVWPNDGLSYSFFCSLLRRHGREWRQGKTYAFMIFLRDGDKDGALVGGITLSDVQRGGAQKGTLGYWIGETHARQGLMTEAIGLVCDFAFDTLHLHRLEASCLPRNQPSQNLLQRLGFEEEGFAKAYLQINGKWEDHVLWGKANPHAAQEC